MIEFFTGNPLLIVHVYVLLVFSLLALSGSDLVCCLKQGYRCARRRRVTKCVIALPLMLSFLAALAFGLFVMGMSHGSGPEDHEVWLLVLGCLIPFILLIFWVVGSLWVDALWVVILIALFAYLLFVNPAIYVRCWANDNFQWAQMWIARHYEEGSGGLVKNEPMARVWYKKAAENGNKDAQYKMGSLELNRKRVDKWYLLAAEQGHVDAMVQAARLVGNEKRKMLLDRAASHNHPEALFMLSQSSMETDLPTARLLLMEAAERGSRSAIVFLITQYQQGGILFPRNSKSARQWKSVLEQTPVSDTDPENLTTDAIDQEFKRAQEKGRKISADDPETLYQQARVLLDHPAKDQLLHDRAVEYLTSAAEKGHSEAALNLAKLAMKNSSESLPNEEAVKWLEVAAIGNHRYALKELLKYYKEKPDVTLSDLEKSIKYNEQLLDVLQSDGNSSSKRFQQQIWSSEYRDTQKQLARLNSQEKLIFSEE